MQELTPSEIGIIVNQAIEEASKTHPINIAESWRLFGTAYEEYQRMHGNPLHLLNLAYSSSSPLIIKQSARMFEMRVQDRFEYFLSKLYDYLWFGEN